MIIQDAILVAVCTVTTCCLDNYTGKPGEDRQCMVGKSQGYGLCKKEGTCPEHLECIETPEGDNICCNNTSVYQFSSVLLIISELIFPFTN